MEQKEKTIFKSENIWERIQKLNYLTQNNGPGLVALQFTFFRNILAGKNGIQADPWHWNIGF
jgi:hypothetical protein